MVPLVMHDTQSRSEKQSKVPLFQTTSRVVNINAVVTDKNGNPVRGLTKDNFTILDNGREQKVGFFSPIDNDAPRPQPQPLPPDTYTNILALRGAPLSITIFIFDALNGHWAGQGYALEHLRKFLRQMKSEDRVGIYVLGDDGLKIVHEFTRDSSDLLDAVHRYDQRHSSSGAEPGATAEKIRESVLDQFLDGKDNRYRFGLEENTHLYGLPSGMPAGASRWAEAKRQASVTTASFEEIARLLESASGRKSVVLLSDRSFALGYGPEFELSQLDPKQPGLLLPTTLLNRAESDFERLIRLMNEAAIAVYNITSQGLETESLGFQEKPNLGSAHPRPTQPLNVGQAQITEQPKLPQLDPNLLDLASHTGGRAFFNRNDLEVGMEKALDDARYTYSLGYYPDHDLWKGEWRKIEVKVNRPDILVLTRQGYFAFPEAPPVPAKQRTEFLSEIAASPIESSQLPITVHVTSKSDSLVAAVHIDPTPMLTNRDDRWNGAFEVVFFQLDDKNHIKDVTTETEELDLKPETYRKLAQDGYTLPARLKLHSGATLLCVILHDRNSDAAGSVRIPLRQDAAALGNRN